MAAARSERGRSRRDVPGPVRTQRVRRGAGASGWPTSTSATRRWCSAGSTGTPSRPTSSRAFHIGRLAVADEDREPVVVDWRAPVAEPFYRATGRDRWASPVAATSSSRAASLLGIEDELFGDGHLGVGHDEGLDGASRPACASRACAATRRCSPRSNAGAPARSATSSPRSRASRTRSSARRSTACSSSRAARAPARPSSRCTARRTCSTRTASRWKTRACS